MLEVKKGIEAKTIEDLNTLLSTGTMTLTQVIKDIPNQVNGLKLSIQDKCSHLKDNNPHNEIINYNIRYDFDVTGTYRFKEKYGIALKKHLKANYGLNQIFYIKEPFALDNKDQVFYQYNSLDEVAKYQHQRYMKLDQARYFVQVTNVEIQKLENFYLKEENFYNTDSNETKKEYDNLDDIVSQIDELGDIGKLHTEGEKKKLVDEGLFTKEELIGA